MTIIDRLCLIYLGVAVASAVVGAIILMSLPPVEPFSLHGILRICFVFGLFVCPPGFAMWVYTSRVERRLKRSAPHT